MSAGNAAPGVFFVKGTTITIVCYDFGKFFKKRGINTTPGDAAPQSHGPYGTSVI